MSFIRVIDFETSGLDPAIDEIIEAGWVDVIADGRIVNPRQAFVCSDRPISPEVRAVHHIRDEEIAGGIEQHELYDLLMDGDPIAFVAHNSKFEQDFAPWLSRPWLDTYRCALRLWPEAPRHTNQVLRYWLGIDLPDEVSMPPHRALPDAIVTAHIFARMLEAEGENRLKRLTVWSKEPGLLPKVLFGEHRGARWEDVPTDYLSWICDKSDMDEDVKFTAWKHLISRKFPAETTA